MHAYSDAHLPRFESRQFEPLRILPAHLEFEEYEDFAGDASDVARTIERDGIIAPEYGAFMFD
jgi:hypothetical protein